MSQQDPIEDYESIKNLSSNWKLIGVITAVVNRSLLNISQLRQHITFHNTKPILIQSLEEPVILDVSYIDVYNMNFHRHIHRSIGADLNFLNSTSTCPASSSVNTDVPPLLKHLLVGLTVMNEHISEFIVSGYESLYNPKVKKAIEYLIQQREYCLSILRIKSKSTSC